MSLYASTALRAAAMPLFANENEMHGRLLEMELLKGSNKRKRKVPARQRRSHVAPGEPHMFFFGSETSAHQSANALRSRTVTTAEP